MGWLGTHNDRATSEEVLIDVKEVSKRSLLFIKLTFFSGVPLIFVNLLQDLYFSAAMVTIYCSLLGLLWILNKRAHIKYTKAGIVILVSLFFSAITITQGKDSGTHFYFLPLIFTIPFLVEDGKDFRKLLIM